MGILDSTQLGQGYVGPVGSSYYSNMGNSDGGGLLSKLLGGGNNSPASTLSQLLASSSQADATNRYLGNQQLNQYTDPALQAQANERANNAADLKQLAQTSYILGGGSKFNPGTLSLNGKTYNVNTMGLGPAPISDAQKQGAQSLQSTLLSNLSNGGSLKNGSYVPTPPQTSPSTGQKVKSGLSGLLAGASAGSALGPIGTIGGGLLGGLLGLF